jgi:mitochondrial import receptor subunit TOM20
VFFDYRRRHSPEFRKALRRNEKKQARAAKDQAVAHQQAQRQAIKRVVDDAKDEGFPTDPDGREAYFLEQVQNGELLGSDREFPRPDSNRT